MVDLRPLYRAVSPGFAERLPFDVFAEQLGHQRFRFGTGEPYGCEESFGIADTLQFGCYVYTTSIEPERQIWDLIIVKIETYATTEQARAVFDARQLGADWEPMEFTELTGTVDRWRAFQHPLPLARHGEYTRTLEMVDRNVTASVALDFIPSRVDERRFASAIIEFATAMWTNVRRSTQTAQITPIASPIRPPIPQRLRHGFSPRWDISALETALGPRIAEPFPDFRSLDASMVGCRLRLAGPDENDSRRPSADITLHIKYFDSADEATAFFTTHFTPAAGPAPARNTFADVTALDWQYRAPAGDHDGMYLIAAADNNTVVLLQVDSRIGDAIIGDHLAGPVADILDTALQLVRAPDGERTVSPLAASAAVAAPRPSPDTVQTWSDDAIDHIDWPRLSHAYGNAADTPGHLRNLTAADITTRKSALLHLWNSITHQESLYTATAPVADLIAQMLVDRRLAELDPLDRERSTRAALLSYLGHVAAWAAYLQAQPNTVAFIRRDDPEAAVFDVVSEPEVTPDCIVVGRLGSGCARRAGAILPLLVPWMDAQDPHERDTALYAVACWAALAAADVPIPRQAVERLTATATDRAIELDRRIDCVLGLSAIGADTRGLLDDTSIVIRACAALSPATDTDPRALQAISAALTTPEHDHSWLRRQPPVPYAAATLSARLVEAALRRTDDFEALLPAALAVAASAQPSSISQTWGPLLTAAFPSAPSPDRPSTTAQHAYLFALTANDAIWQHEHQERDELLRKLGLPPDRESAQLLATAAEPSDQLLSPS